MTKNNKTIETRKYVIEYTIFGFRIAFTKVTTSIGGSIAIFNLLTTTNLFSSK